VARQAAPLYTEEEIFDREEKEEESNLINLKR
jgi:hypothetical protein